MVPSDLSAFFSIIFVSLEVSSASTLFATLPAIGIGLVLAIERFRGRDFLITLMYTALAFPTVVIGLFVYLLLSRSGPFGALNLLFTRSAIVIGQVILIMPIIATFSLSALQKLDPMLLLTARSLGAGRFRLYLTLLNEARYGVFAAVIAAFGRAVSEVGVSMILGGNIYGCTRTMTTAIALEHDKGQFIFALVLGAVLLSMSLLINLAFRMIQKQSEN